MSNLEGKLVFGDKWQTINETHLYAYMGLLILDGAYKSRNEFVGQRERPSYISCNPVTPDFSLFSRKVFFHNRDIRPAFRERDKLAVFRVVCYLQVN